MQQRQDHDLSVTIDDQLAQIERLAEAIRALPEYNAFRAASRTLYADPGANCRMDELPMRLYEARKHHRPLADDFCGRESVQAYIHAEVHLSELLSLVERVLSHATGIAFCEDIELETDWAPGQLPPTLRYEVKELGHILAAHPAIRANREAESELAADAYASKIDLRFETLRLQLKAHQRAMEDIRPVDVTTFQELREAVLANALIEERDRARDEARHYLGRVIESLNRKLGLDFVAMARG